MNLVATDLSLNFSLSVTIIQVREAADHIDTVNIYFHSDPAVKSFIYVSYKQRWCIHLGQEDQQSHAD